MALIKNLALMSVSTGSRFAAGLISFAVMARLLGPADFGVLMLWLSVAGLLSMVSNFGITPYLLREIGVHPNSAALVVNEVFTGKLILTGVVLSISLVICAFIGSDVRLMFLLLLGGMVAETFTEFLNAGFRAGDRYGAETRMATISALIYCVVTVAMVWFWTNVISAAIAFFFTRLLVAGLTLHYLGRFLGRLKLSTIENGFVRLKQVRSYAVDFGFQSLFGQVDSLVINYFIGPTAVGIYQAGMKIYMGGSQAAQILANVFLPRAAGRSVDAERFSTEAFRLQFAFLFVGAVFGVVLSTFAELIVEIIYGKGFSDLALLLPWFGLLFFVRHAAAAWGILLTAVGSQAYRTKANAAHWVVIVVAAIVLIPVLGSRGWLASVIVGNIALGATYAVGASRYVKSAWKTLGMTFLFGLAFIPLISWK